MSAISSERDVRRAHHVPGVPGADAGGSAQAPSRAHGTVWLWAAAGVAGFAYMAWVWIPWLLGGQARQPSPGPTTTYQIPWDWMSMTAGPQAFPVLPSYLQPGEDCGQPRTPLCASEYLYRLRHHQTPAGAIVRGTLP
jgi:hypothetical protein